MVSLCVLLLVGPAFAEEGEITTASSWIWYPENVATEGADQTRYLRRMATVEGPVEEARLRVLADDSYTLTINGVPPPTPTETGLAGAVYDLSKVLVVGENVLAFAVHNSVGMGGLIVTGSIREAGRAQQAIHSDASFRTAREAPDGWDRPGFDDSAWPAAHTVGSAFALPWYQHPAFDMQPFIEPADRERYAAWRAPLVALPKALEAEPAAKAALTYVNGSCALVIDGKPRPALIYRGTVDPFTKHGRRQIGLFRDVGVHVYTAHPSLATCWRAPDTYDFASIDDTIRAYLSADPDAHLIVLFSLVPPEWWMDAYPDDLVQYAAGPDYNTTDESGRVRRPSLASQAWRRDALALWRAVIAHLEQQPWGKRVIGYHPCYGIYGEWHYYGSWTEQMPDTGPAMTADFREWLRERYGADARLREVWRQPEATLDAATVPGVDARLAAGALGLRDGARGAWVTDYYCCQQAITADDVDLFCAAAKEATKSRVICGAFYGYFQGVPPQTQGGHLELGRLLRSPHIDYFAAPYDYSHRLMGDDGRSRAIIDAFPLAGKVHMIEADTRTHLHPLDEYGRLSTPAESIAAIRREVATALTHGAALWWCDFGADGSGGWYDAPELIEEIGRLYALAERRLSTPRNRTAEVAVVCDLPSCFLLGDGEAMRTHYRLVDAVTTELYRTGVPFDTILLSQLKGADLSRYRLLIFLNALHVDPRTRELVRAETRDRAVLWLWAPGISDGSRFDPTLVTDLTGFRVRLPGMGIPAGTVTCDQPDPLTDRLAPRPAWNLQPRETNPVPAALQPESWFNPRDEKLMKERYTAFSWGATGDGFRWTFGTLDSWTDIHLRAAIKECAGLSLSVSGEGEAVGARLRVVVKGSDAAEFVAPAFSVTAAPTTHLLPFAGFVRAPWHQGEARTLTFPLTGGKLVLDGLAGGRVGTLIIRDLSAVDGELAKREAREYGDPASACPVLAIEDEKAAPLGRDPETGAILLAAKGQAPSRHVLSTVPFLPREVIAALMDQAGVCRYIDSPAVIVGADSDLISLHTAAEGKYELRLPRPATVVDAFTGKPIGRGTRMTVDLPPTSTTLLRLQENH